MRHGERQTAPSRALRERVFARSGGVCQRAGCEAMITLETFHVAHLRAHASGGPLHESNLEAWCARCNLTVGARNAGDNRLRPREWQLQALDEIIATIARTGAATVSAAPGAGKTVFAGLVFEALYEAGLVDRMLVLVPRHGLANQWSDELAAKRHVQLKPHSAIERAGQHGAAVTYQSLGGCDQPAAACEVHHVTHQACGGKTSVQDCQLYCFFHHHIVIHQMGWTVVRSADGTTVAFSPDGKKVLRSHSPRSRPTRPPLAALPARFHLGFRSAGTSTRLPRVPGQRDPDLDPFDPRPHWERSTTWTGAACRRRSPSTTASSASVSLDPASAFLRPHLRPAFG